MIKVEPKIFFLAEPCKNDDGIEAWLHHIGGDEAVACLDHVNGSDIEQLVELLARRCYKSYAPGLNPNVKKIRTNSSDYHENIAKQRHGSVVANGGMVTYAIEDVSRVFTHEIVRNTIGTERSQESLRYVRLTDIRFWTPPLIANATDRKLVPHPFRGDRELKRQVLMNPIDIFDHVVDACEWAQQALADYYDINNIPDFETKKKLTSAFRRVAPEGLATGIVMSFNLRAMRWIIEQRTSRHAEEEMRIVFGLIAEDAIKHWPMFFQDFQKVDTNDGLFEYVPVYSKI